MIRAGAFAALVLATLAVASPCVAQDVTLKYKPAPGERWSFDEETAFKLSFKVLANGQVAQTIDQTTRTVKKGDVTFLEAAGGKVDAVRARYAPECGETTEATGAAPQKKASGLAGKTVTVRRQTQGEPVVEGAASLSDEEKKDVRDLLDPSEGFLPKKPVKVGDRWIADERAIARELQLGPEDRGTLRCRLKAVRDVDGRKTAEIDVGLVVDKKEEFMKITLDLEGTVLLDVETGMTVGVDLAGPATVSGETEQKDENGNAVKISVDGSGECKSARTAKKLAAETGGAAPAPAPASGPVGQIDLKYVLPAGWEKKDAGDAILLEKWENKGETFYNTERQFRLLILATQPLVGSLRETFLRTWDVQVKGICQTSVVPLPLMRRLASGRAVAYDVDDHAKNKNGVEMIVSLYLLSQGTRVVPVIGIHSGLSDGLEKDLTTLIESAEIPGAGDGKAALFDPADLAGVWNNSSYSMASYVTPGGGYAGDASIAIGETFTLNADGTFKYWFAAVRGSGPTVTEKSSGNWKIDDEWLVLAGQKDERYRLFGAGADPKVGQFLVISTYAYHPPNNAPEQLRLSAPRGAFQGTWFKRKEN